MTLPPDINDTIASTVQRHVELCNSNRSKPVQIMPDNVRGDVFAMDDGRQITRDYHWIEVPADDRAVRCAVRHLMNLVMKHGPGRIWFLWAPVHLIKDDGLSEREGLDGFPVCRLRTIYFHEALAK